MARAPCSFRGSFKLAGPPLTSPDMDYDGVRNRIQSAKLDARLHQGLLWQWSWGQEVQSRVRGRRMTQRGRFGRHFPSTRENSGTQHAPAFFSCMVSSFQLPLMRSRRDIQRSACSCRGMPSHRFSMLARVGLEMAWVDEAREATAAALRTRPLRSRLDAGVRSMLGGCVCVFRRRKEVNWRGCVKILESARLEAMGMRRDGPVELFAGERPGMLSCGHD